MKPRYERRSAAERQRVDLPDEVVRVEGAKDGDLEPTLNLGGILRLWGEIRGFWIDHPVEKTSLVKNQH